jgi:hypothetical protein
LFATRVVYISGKFAPSVVDTCGNLPLASLTSVENLPVVKLKWLAKMLTKMLAKFAASVVDTGGAPSIVNISENLRKNCLNRIFWGWGETDS